MILYFDSYITDVPLNPKSRKQVKDNIRQKSEAYKMPKKIDIAKYTLASYALYPWSHVLIRYKLDDVKEYKKFDNYILSLFPKAKIMHKRSNNQEEYRNSIKILDKYNDDWIFYAPNNDHPLISSNKKIVKYINELIKMAEKWKKKYKYVSIMYSHFSVFLNISKKGTVENLVEGRMTKLLEQNDKAIVYLNKEGDFSSVQVVHKDHIKKWFDSEDLGESRVIRAEDVREKVTIKDQVILVPKFEICAHFDQNLHMLGTVNEIQSDQIPPLFIPNGFFDNKVKISYGYSNYKEGWVNINPIAKKYSFRDYKHGTDLKISLEGVPLFWSSHIEKIDINPNLDKKLIEHALKNQREILFNPWSLKTQGLNFNSIIFWTKFQLYKQNLYFRKKLSRIKIYLNEHTN